MNELEKDYLGQKIRGKEVDYNALMAKHPHEAGDLIGKYAYGKLPKDENKQIKFSELDEQFLTKLFPGLHDNPKFQEIADKAKDIPMTKEGAKELIESLIRINKKIETKDVVDEIKKHLEEKLNNLKQKIGLSDNLKIEAPYVAKTGKTELSIV